MDLEFVKSGCEASMSHSSISGSRTSTEKPASVIRTLSDLKRALCDKPLCKLTSLLQDAAVT